MKYSGPSSKPHDTGVAVAIFVERDGLYLLMKREGSVGAGTWAVPGGSIEFMEDPIEAAARELKEETGIQNPKLHFVGYSNHKHHEEKLHYVTFLYKVTGFKGKAEIKEPHKCSEIGWFPLDNLPSPLFSVLKTKLEDKALIKALNEIR